MSGNPSCDFFISYTGVDEAWARWIAVELERAGYTTISQVLDFRPGQDFVHRIHGATLSATKTLAILSAAYFSSEFGEAEWRTAFANDPAGEHGLLIPVRVQHCRPPGLLRARIYIDLVDVDEELARKRLLDGVGPAATRPTLAQFPGRRPNLPIVAQARFPGAVTRQSRASTAGVELPRSRQITPPPLGDIADRSGIREPLMAALLAASRNRRSPVVFLEGYGGAGKTTLAIQSANSVAIRERYPGGVIWTAIGQSRTGSDLADHIGDMCEHISGHRPKTSDPTMAGATLGEILDEGPPVLLVVDDVWSHGQVRPFLLGACDCARLFTTRNRNVAPPDATTIEVGRMTTTEARTTALAGLPSLDHSSIERLLDFAKGWPVLLGLINASLRVHITAGGPPHEVVPWVVDLVEASGPSALDSSAPGDLHSTIEATVTASLEFLSLEEQDRYFDLAVFKDDCEVPLNTITLLWSVTGGFDVTQSRQMVARLSALRLIEDRWSQGAPAVSVHDVLRAYILHQLSGADLARRHAALVVGMRQLLGNESENEWWNLPADQPFALQYLPYHLSEAGEHDQLARLACDLRWIEAQIRNLGSVVPALATLSTVPTERAARLREVLDQNIDLLVPDVVPSAIGATLVSRIEGLPELYNLAIQHLANLPRPLLQNYWPPPDAAPVPDEGHSGPIGDCAVSDDGRLLATASDDRLVMIWDIESMTVRQVLRGHRQRARACAFSPDSSQLLSAGMDGTVRIWDVQTGALLHTLGDRANRMLGCAWSADGVLVAGASGNGAVTVWHAETGEIKVQFDSPSGFEWDCSFSPDERFLLSCGEDGVLRTWDLGTGEVVREARLHSSRIRCCTYDSSGRIIATAGSDNLVTLVGADSGAVLHTLRGHTDRVRECVFSSDGTLLASASEDRSVRLWEVRSGRELMTLHGHTDWVGGCAFTPDDSQLVTCGGDGAIVLWDVATGDMSSIVNSKRGAVGCCAFSMGSSKLVAGGSDGRIALWESEAAVWKGSISGHTGRVLACSASDSKFVTGGADGALHLWDAQSGERLQTYTSHAGRVWACTLAPDESWMASAGEDGVVMIHDVVLGNVIHALNAHDGHVLDCAISPSGNSLASVGDDGTLRLWDALSGELTGTLSTGNETALWSCHFSPDGSLIAAAGEPAQTVTLWSTEELVAKSSIAVEVDRITNCTFSPSGDLLATCGDDGLLSVWDVSTGAALCGVRVAYPLKMCAWGQIADATVVAAAGNGGLYLFRYVSDLPAVSRG